MSAARNDHNYAYGIDLLRFSAATIVAVFHFTLHNATEYKASYFGWIGVQVFFVISGLVIANSAEGASSGTFLRGRVLRLYPAAIACTLISFLCLWGALGGVGVDFGTVLRSATLWIHKPWVNGAYWTLPIEISFYAMVFLLLAADRFRYIGTFACALTILCAPYLLCVYAHALGLLWLPDLNYGYGLVNLSLLRHGQYFALGIFIFLLRQGRGESALVRACFVLGLFDGAVEILIESLHVAPLYGIPMAVSTVYLTGLAIWLASVALLVQSTFLAERFPSDVRVRATVRQLGLMTYPLYLMHINVGERVIEEMTARGMRRSAAVMLALVISMAAAFVVSTFVEPRLRAVFKTWMGTPSRRLSPQ